MTCIVGIAQGGRVYLGGDSAGVAGYSLTVRKDPKVFTNGAMVIGMTSSFRMGNVLRYAFTPPGRVAGQDVMAYMCTSFIDAVRAAFRNAGYLRTENGVETGGTFLVGYEGRLFKIDCDYQVGEANGYDACGCGDEIAAGALFATQDWQDPEARLKIALAAAETHSAGVRGPFTFVATP